MAATTHPHRSWNQFQSDIDQALITAHMDALADRSRMVNGAPTSLADLGYSDAGIDDAWQLCGAYGQEKLSYHDPVTGAPYVNTTRFPSLRNLTSYAHALNLTCGWYHNNCKCKETNPVASSGYVFAADAAAALAFGFDSIKLDGCGQEENVQLWYDLLSWGAKKAGRRALLVENCHNGPNQPTREPEWCPFHQYRASTDIAPVYGSILANINTIPAIASGNLSYPGCWAYAGARGESEREIGDGGVATCRRAHDVAPHGSPFLRHPLLTTLQTCSKWALQTGRICQATLATRRRAPTLHCGASRHSR